MKKVVYSEVAREHTDCVAEWTASIVEHVCLGGQKCGKVKRVPGALC